jgi:hypothetical protein
MHIFNMDLAKDLGASSLPPPKPTLASLLSGFILKV